MKKKWRRVLPVLLSLALLVASVRPVYAEEDTAAAAETDTEQEGYDHDHTYDGVTDTTEPESPESKPVETEESPSLPEQPAETATEDQEADRPSQEETPTQGNEPSQEEPMQSEAPSQEVPTQSEAPSQEVPTQSEAPSQEEPTQSGTPSQSDEPSQDDQQTEDQETTVTEETESETQETETEETVPDPALSLLAMPAAENLPQAMADSPAPVITVTVAEGGHGSQDFYCEPPKVEVTDADGDLSKITVTASGGAQQEADVGDKRSVTVVLPDKDSSITIKAEDEAGNTAEVSFYIGHVLGGRISTVIPATCTKPAKERMYYICRNCGSYYYSYDLSKDLSSPALGHEYDSGKAITIDGVSVSPCKHGCGEMVKENNEVASLSDEQLGKADHVHAWEEKEVAATCTSAGYKYQECMTCHIVKGREETSTPLGHKLGSWNVTKEMNCATNTPGETKRKCARECGFEETRSIPVTHDFSVKFVSQEPTCTDPGQYSYRCSRCPEERPSIYMVAPLGHDYEDDHDCTTQSKCTRCQQTVPGQSSHNLKLVKTDTQHQWKCTNDGCNYQTSAEGHTSSSGANDCTKDWMCSACGALVRAKYESHNYADAYEVSGDGVFHRKMCQNPGCQQGEDWTRHTVGTSNDCTVAVTCRVCGYVVREAQQQHTTDGVWHYTISNHWQTCTNEGCTVAIGGRADHVGLTDDGDCTTDIKCSDCGYISYHGFLQHNFYNAPLQADAQGHYRQCRNARCTFKQREGEHSGGEATCVQKKICDICLEPYGEVDPNRHERTEIVGIKEATETEDGYTGDKKCLSCGAVVEQGTVIPRLTETCDHQMETYYDDLGSWEECSKCGHTTKKISHDLETKTDDTYHWQKCRNCRYETMQIPHASSASISDCTKDVVCDECEYIIRKGESAHRYDEKMAYDGSGHWHICINPECTQTGEVQAHVPGADDGDCTTDTVCQECGYVITPASSDHNWSETWKSDADGHYAECQNENCQAVNRQPHEFIEEDGLCTTPVFCTVCGWVSVEAKESHDFGGAYMHNETGHWRVCQNEGCTAVEPEEAHGGGMANCVAAAVCASCGQHYGEKDPGVHIGDQEYRDYKAPTEETEGYSGDLYCLSCGNIVEYGHPLNKIPSGHEHIFDEEKFDDTHHWMECECGVRNGYEEHSYESWLTDDTHHQRICKECGHSKSEAHLLEWASDSESHWQKCSICEHTGAKEPHYAELVGYKEPTEWEDGYTGDSVCAVCGIIMGQGQVIPAVHKGEGGSSPDGGQNDPDSDSSASDGGTVPAASDPAAPTLTAMPEIPSSAEAPAAEAHTPSTPVTGDETTAALWLVLMALSGGALTGVWEARRKRNR